jgi:hypothetical protein
MQPTEKRTDLMELHPSRTNYKKLISFINTALNLARPDNREKQKTRDHRPEQRQINSLKLRFPQTIRKHENESDSKFYNVVLNGRI